MITLLIFFLILPAQICIDTNRELVSLPLILSLGDLELNQGREKKFFIRAHRVGNRNINIKVISFFFIKL